MLFDTISNMINRLWSNL